jgi:NitT/TauT family transport system permease protein
MGMVKSKTLYGASVLLAFWYILSISMKSNIIPSPYETVITFFKLIGENLLVHAAVSIYRIFIAILISLLIGVPLGLCIGLNNHVDKIISPITYLLYPLPKIAFLPIFMMLFGLGDSSKIILIITIIIFPILIAARDGVREIPKELFYSVKSLGLSQWGIYANLVLPAVLPKIISSLRISIGISISALFFAENFATTYGIGYLIMNAWSMVDYPQMFAGILTLSLMGLFIFKLIDIAERKLCPWLFINKSADE